MGWGSILKKVAMPIGAAVAAPFTGGTSLAWLPTALGAGGAALGAGSQASASNRGNQFAGQADLAQLLMARDIAGRGLERDADNDFVTNTIAREQEGRAGRQDAWRKLLSAQRVTNPGPSPQLAGPYNIAPRERTDAEKRGATALSEEAFARLQTGNPMPEVTRRDPSLTYDPMTTIDPNLLKAGKGETVSGWLGALLSSIGQSQNRNPYVMFAGNAPYGAQPPRG